MLRFIEAEMAMPGTPWLAFLMYSWVIGYPYLVPVSQSANEIRPYG